MFSEEVGQSVPQPGRGHDGQHGLQSEDCDPALVCGVQRLLHQAGQRLGVDLVLLRVHGEHAPGPGGAVVQVGQEVSQLGPVQHHARCGEPMVGEDGLGEGEADRGALEDGLDLDEFGGEPVGRVPDVVIAGQAVDTLSQSGVDPPGIRCFVIILNTEN